MDDNRTNIPHRDRFPYRSAPIRPPVAPRTAPPAAASGPAAMMRRRRELSDEDRTLFREAVKDVQPLRHDKVDPYRALPYAYPRQRDADEQAVLRDLLSDSLEPWDLETGEELSFARPGLQHTVLRKLRRGQYAVGAQIDLHGMTVAEARPALAQFLAAARLRNVRCVRIVHGKGNGSYNKLPVLKAKVGHWLRQRAEVLAYSSALPTDGGTGAMYVLLKRG